jgi:hypothetical protein
MQRYGRTVLVENTGATLLSKSPAALPSPLHAVAPKEKGKAWPEPDFRII